ncbi:MAG: GDSL-type esterase/lipase family protein, partial [Gemmataceae bacterium]
MSVACRRLIGWGLCAVVGLVLGFESASLAQGKATTKAEPRPQPFWMARHESFLKRAAEGHVDVLFVGDSITQGWEGSGKAVWAKHFEPLKAANFGIGGDRTQHVLWRITEGKELQGIKPKAAVLMIGTNNMGSDSAEDIADGVKAIVQE